MIEDEDNEDSAEITIKARVRTEKGILEALDNWADEVKHESQAPTN